MRRYLFFTLIVLSAFLSVRGTSYAFVQGAEQECVKCHTLNAEQAKDVLSQLAPDVKILDIQPAPVAGFWEIGLQAGGQKSILYLDFSKKKLLLGNVLDIKTRTNYTKTSFDKINKVDLSQVPLENSLVMGDKDAKYKIIVFDDPD